MTKAIVSKVKIGYIEFDGLMLPDGEFAMGASQLAEILLFDKNQASRGFKALLGEGFRFDKASSELNSKVREVWIAVMFAG